VAVEGIEQIGRQRLVKILGHVKHVSTDAETTARCSGDDILKWHKARNRLSVTSEYDFFAVRCSGGKL
jgi:hypothetical protein